ncbi:MAG: hypothetical protein QGI87_01395 [Candidatus Bathyarchaeota archaeon]|jgi:hypothetical protein|nr:hypothetical protein [Candidatus Bathyarchaeota archaeon]MDP7442994.1 hypothetical protein [Candidatus Bathyarchaeota archaeon]
MMGFPIENCIVIGVREAVLAQAIPSLHDSLHVRVTFFQYHLVVTSVPWADPRRFLK